MIKLVIADDHKIFRAGLKFVLSMNAQINLVGEASNGTELIDLVTLLNPDVVLTDILMPEMDGKEAAKHILSLHPEIGIIALSMFTEDEIIMDIIEVGVHGYLTKNSDPNEIMEAIERVYNKERYYSKSLPLDLICRINNNKKATSKKQEVIKFNKKEVEIIKFICQELTSKEIADKVRLSNRTVEGYRCRIMEKIGVKTPAGIALYALKNRLIER